MTQINLGGIEDRVRKYKERVEKRMGVALRWTDCIRALLTRALDEIEKAETKNERRNRKAQ